jgi:hypothetical protein
MPYVLLTSFHRETSREEPSSYRGNRPASGGIGLASHSHTVGSRLTSGIGLWNVICVDESRVEDEQCLIEHGT